MKAKNRIKSAILLESDGVVNEYFTCECSNPEHCLQVSFDPDIFDDSDNIAERHPELTVNVQMSQYLGFWKRLLVAIKYIFNVKDDKIHWDCCSIREEEVDRLLNVVKLYKESLEEIKEHRKAK